MSRLSLVVPLAACWQVALLVAHLPLYPATVLPCLARLVPSLLAAGSAAVGSLAAAISAFLAREPNGKEAAAAAGVLRALARQELLMLAPSLLGDQLLPGTTAVELRQLEVRR